MTIPVVDEKNRLWVEGEEVAAGESHPWQRQKARFRAHLMKYQRCVDAPSPTGRGVGIRPGE